MAKIFITDLAEGEPVTSFFLAKQIMLRQRRRGEPFLTLVLADRTGEVAAVMWEGAEEAAKDLKEGDIVKVQGLLGAYQGERQLTLSRLRPAIPDEVTPDDYLPRSPLDPDVLLARIRETVEAMREPHLQRLLRELFADASFIQAITSAPAAKTIHHAVLGGLLEHTASVVGLCGLLADYYPAVDRDLLLAAAILHDVGKIRELAWDRVFDYTDAGRLLGHITLGTMLVEERIRSIPDFPEQLAHRLLHCILSHHGELEWGSPKRPKTLEALVLHYAEDLDGKVNSFLSFSRDHPDPQRPGWTQFNKLLDRYLYFGAGEVDASPPPE
ncbi:MAG TPA: HD domain-containing protein [Candidatus Methylomirabilis sp.]|nr:HD domain-containing protein [Candidatus Methylomirabilis sp.]